jgi:hypothetical protein
VEEIARTTGREIRFTTITIDEFTSPLAAAGLPPDAVRLVRYLFSEVLDGRNANPGAGVQQALNRAPRDFTDYATPAAASGIWNTR